jgi:tetratricopeptide (TPR) repeat protein
VSLVASVVMLASKNATLTVERNAAREAEREADHQKTMAKLSEENATTSYHIAKLNEQIAAAERKKATLRLERAVDAVERMMVRVAGEKWANRPDLQQERREVLEEAVFFFRGLSSDESKDPIVRRQAARAYLQSAAAYLALGEYDRTREMAGAAAEGYAGLATDAPADPAPFRGRAEATAMLGHVAAIGGEFPTALDRYQAAAALAARAVDLDPNDEDSQVVLAETYSSLAMYYSISAPPRAAEFNAKALGIAERLTERPSPGYKARLILAVALTNTASLEINQGRPADGAKKIERARAIIPVLEKRRPPSAHAAERLVTTKSGLQVLHGMQLFRSGKRDDGIAEVRAGVDTIRSLAAVQSKAFPIRYQLLQQELTYAGMLGQDGKVADARAALDRVDVLRDALLADHPKMTWLKSFGPTQRSNFLVLAARTGAAEEVVRGFTDLEYGLDDRGAQVVRYNRACAYAQLAATGPPADRATYADKAVADLTALLDTTYFESPANRDHLDDDTDLDPLRSREDFKRFLSRAKAIRSSPPTTHESAPPPRKVDLK